jgi:hypothetical protein
MFVSLVFVTLAHSCTIRYAIHTRRAACAPCGTTTCLQQAAGSTVLAKFNELHDAAESVFCGYLGEQSQLLVAAFIHHCFLA